MEEVYILSVIDRKTAAVREQEVFDTVPKFAPEETGYSPNEHRITVRVANVNGGDSAQLYWDRGKWHS